VENFGHNLFLRLQHIIVFAIGLEGRISRSHDSTVIQASGGQAMHGRGAKVAWADRPSQQFN
jgi:hypothetical protein